MTLHFVICGMPPLETSQIILVNSADTAGIPANGFGNAMILFDCTISNPRWLCDRLDNVIALFVATL